MKLIGMSCIFPSRAIRRTAEYYKTKLKMDCFWTKRKIDSNILIAKHK